MVRLPYNRYDFRPDGSAAFVPQPSFADEAQLVCGEIAGMLISKNAAYGDSALNPVRIFSKADAIEQIRVRIDDKLSRLSRGSDAGEDVVSDLLGYLVMYKIALRRAEGKK